VALSLFIGRGAVANSTVPLFPLHTVLFPDGPLPLRIFEPRYLDMISRCMKESGYFGVVLVDEAAADQFSANKIGTLANIVDWYQGSDGILGVTAHGNQRFMLHDVSVQSDGLYVGEVEVLEEEAPQKLPDEFRGMADLLRNIIDDLGLLYTDFEKRYDDATWVGYRFAEILPISLDEKQYCLEQSDPIARLEFLQPLLRTVRQETSQ